LTDFRRGNPRWRAAFAKLKLAAEQAKIRISREQTVEIAVDPLCVDDKGDRVALDFELGRKEVEDLIEPFVLRSINICKKVLTEKRLGPGDIQKVLLVGGPTQTPYVRQRLASDLGIALEAGIDPMTIVAKGAAIFAGTQRLEATVPVASVGTFNVTLEYQPVGTDPEPLVGGKVLGPQNTDLAGYTIEFLDPTAHPPRRSGRLTGFFRVAAIGLAASAAASRILRSMPVVIGIAVAGALLAFAMLLAGLLLGLVGLAWIESRRGQVD
jgi:molecular chaperone DnaK